MQTENKTPKVFVVYSWDSHQHSQWVKSFVDALICKGINVYFGQYGIEFGGSLATFLEKNTREAEYILIICTTEFKEKANKRHASAGLEGSFMFEELFTKENDEKYIPIVREGNPETVLPDFLVGKSAVILKDGDPNYQKSFDMLCELLLNKQKEVQHKPVNNTAKQKTESGTTTDFEYIDTQIVGVDIEKTTPPRNDGTIGSDLYKVALKLSKAPSFEWKKIFVETWNNPLMFSVMHRPFIASVVGDDIILDGTTIEEISKYHKPTLIKCVKKANETEQQMLLDKTKQEQKEEEAEKSFYDHLQAVASELKF